MELEWKWLKNKLIENKYKLDLNKILLDEKNTKEEIENFEKLSYLKKKAKENNEIKDFLNFVKENNDKFKNMGNTIDNFNIFIKKNGDIIEKFFEKYINIIENKNCLELLCNYFYYFSSLIYDSYLLHILIKDGGNSIYKKNNDPYQWSFFYKVAFKENLSYFELSKSKFEFILNKFYWLNYGNEIEMNYEDKDNIFSLIEKKINQEGKNKFSIQKNNKKFFENFELWFFYFEKNELKNEEIYKKKWRNIWDKDYKNIFKFIKQLRNIYEHNFNQEDIINILFAQNNFLSKNKIEEINNIGFQFYRISLFLFFSFLIFLDEEINIKINKKIEENIEYLKNNWFFEKVKTIDDLKYYYDFFKKINTNNFVITGYLLFLCKKNK